MTEFLDMLIKKYGVNECYMGFCSQEKEHHSQEISFDFLFQNESMNCMRDLKSIPSHQCSVVISCLHIKEEREKADYARSLNTNFNKEIYPENYRKVRTRGMKWPLFLVQ